MTRYRPSVPRWNMPTPLFHGQPEQASRLKDMTWVELIDTVLDMIEEDERKQEPEVDGEYDD
jgi:hypothetical protein